MDELDINKKNGYIETHKQNEDHLARNSWCIALFFFLVLFFIGTDKVKERSYLAAAISSGRYIISYAHYL